MPLLSEENVEHAQCPCRAHRNCKGERAMHW